MRKPAFRILLAFSLALNAALYWLWRQSQRVSHRLETLDTTMSPPAAQPAAPAIPAPPLSPATVESPISRATGALSSHITPFTLIALALTFAIVGQSDFAQGPDSPLLPWGLLFYLVAIALFTIAIVQSDRLAGASAHPHDLPLEPDAAPSVEPIEPATPAAPLTPVRVLALLLVVVMTFVMLERLRVDPPLSDYTLPFLLWLGAIGLFIRTTVPLRRRSRPIGSSPWQSHWRIAAALIVIVLIALALRVWDLSGIPPTFSGDEGSFGLESVKTMTGAINNPFTTAWLSVPTMTFYFNSIPIRLLGRSVFAARLPWALVGTVTVLIAYQLVRRLTGRTIALIAAGLLATYHFHIHFSRLGMNNAADPLLVGLMLLLLYRAIDRRSPLDWALCGVTIGVAQYFYFGGRFAAIVAGVLIAYELIRDIRRFWREQWRGLLILIGAALITSAPMIQYAIRYPNDYNARVNQIGLIQSGLLDAIVKVTGQNPIAVLLDQFQRAALAFNVYPDRTPWYASPQPLFDFAAGVLFLLGLGYGTLRPGDRRLFPMVVWWWGATILGGALTESPPSSQRLITLAPVAVFFVGLAMLKIGQVVQRAWREFDPRLFIPYFAAATLALSLSSMNWYFAVVTPQHAYGGYNGAVAQQLAEYMRDKLGPDWRVYFIGPPRLFIGFGSILFLAPDVEGVDIIEPLTAPLDPTWIMPGKNAAFVFLPERINELDWVRATFPDGELDDVPSLWEGDPNPTFFIVYKVALRASQ